MHRSRIRLAQRRDAGGPREPAPGRAGPEGDAAFGRKRAAAVTAVVNAPPPKRARMYFKAPIGLSHVARDAAEVCGIQRLHQLASSIRWPRVKGTRRYDICEALKLSGSESEGQTRTARGAGFDKGFHNPCSRQESCLCWTRRRGTRRNGSDSD
jgi:hypothetical protein